jgi:hypothetical protein
MNAHTAYPTPQHQRAAQAIVDYFSRQPDVQAVLLTCSCARGKAVPESCLDVAILLLPEALAAKRAGLEGAWEGFYNTEPVFQPLLQIAKYSHVDLEFISGDFSPGYHGWTSGADEFELELGNFLAYSVPLWERGAYLAQLKAQWLPYYGEELRQERLALVRRFCLNNLHHIPPFAERALYFQCLRRLYNAFSEFLQALFISRRVYPIAYDKWIREQIVEILGLPELYPRLARLFEFENFESLEVVAKADELEQLLDGYCAG